MNNNFNLKLESAKKEVVDPKDEIANHSSSKKPDNSVKKKLMKLMFIIVIVVLVVILTLFIVSLIMGRKQSYSSVETTMKNAAIKYYSDHKNRLPAASNSNEGVEVTTLVSGEYMKPLSEYLGENTKCTGKVTVERNGENFVYTPYLDCGNSYKTIELVKQVTNESNIVVTGDGLYNINNTYIFRGENVKNYLKLDDDLWRIVKITSDNKIYLIKDEFRTNNLTVPWDDRYNTIAGYNAGINDYKVSRLREEVIKKYNSNAENGKILSKTARQKLTKFDLCIGSRDPNYVSNDNSAECSTVLKNQKVGLLTLSDYLIASIDSECISPLSSSCQNYNYLKSNSAWWVTTANSENTYQVYRIESNGVVKKTYALSYAAIRPVVVLNERTMYATGTGTKSNPYKIK